MSSDNRNTDSRSSDLAGPCTSRGIVVVTVLVVLPRLIHRAIIVVEDWCIVVLSNPNGIALSALQSRHDLLLPAPRRRSIARVICVVDVCVFVMSTSVIVLRWSLCVCCFFVFV